MRREIEVDEILRQTWFWLIAVPFHLWIYRAISWPKLRYATNIFINSDETSWMIQSYMLNLTAELQRKMKFALTCGQVSKLLATSLLWLFWKTVSRGMEFARMCLSKWKVARWLPEVLLVLLIWSGGVRRVSWASGHRSTVWFVHDALAFSNRPARSRLNWIKRGFQCVSRML